MLTNAGVSLSGFPILLIGALCVLLLGRAAHAGARLSLESVDGNATIELSCDDSKRLDLAVTGHHRPPIVSPADPAIGLTKRGTVRYTFDGQEPILEQWLAREEGAAPRDPGQLSSFAQRLFLGHVLFISLNGMKSFEFQLDHNATRLKNFAQVCVQRP